MASPSQSRDGSSSEAMPTGLSRFTPWVRDWFLRDVGEPTPPQRRSWPEIQAGHHVLIHAPTGSGKTFAAFLWALDELLRNPVGPMPGVSILYVSPLRALNYDIERNLEAPLHGIIAEADGQGVDVRKITTAVRTGDTPSAQRAAMVRKPPDILITTPESLYLILTSPKARRILETVRTVILDEIHTISSTKRGAHTALSLERLEAVSPGFQRIGLSATQHPLEEVARFLGGQQIRHAPPGISSEPRPVSIIDVAGDKRMEVQVVGMPTPTPQPQAGAWPRVIPRLLREISKHETTLVFANSRRQAERAADRLNAFVAEEGEASKHLDETNAPLKYTGGIFSASSEGGPFRAHHGSISDEQRREMERDLKAGKLPALIGTSSLELGIDIGSVDLVVQLGSPKSATQGLQRVGRSGHSVGETSRGLMYALHPEDLLESAVIARRMIDRRVEAIRIPRNALDVLAQQIVAAVSIQDWRIHDLFRLVRGAYPYSDLSFESFKSVLKLVSGKYPSSAFKSLRARIYWDEIGETLHALPGSGMHALGSGGTIVDKGEFPVYLADGAKRIGELDEEFVFETHPGDAFMLGSQIWRAVEITDHHVTVEPAPGAMPRMPFWNGEGGWRPFELSVELAECRRHLADRIRPYVDQEEEPEDVVEWLQASFPLDDAAARQLIRHIRGQLRAVGTVSSDRTIVAETFADAVGDWRLVVHSPFGGRINAPWAIAMADAIREATHVAPEMQVGDDGFLFRLPASDSDPPSHLIEEVTPGDVRKRLLAQLPDSALFGAAFRQNASRALLLPSNLGASRRHRLGRSHGTRARTPFWLQRLRAKDLLSIARKLSDFPVMLETYRDCLEDAMDLPNLMRIVESVQRGAIDVVPVRTQTPSPVARSLGFEFTSFYLYEWDAPKAERSFQALQLDRKALSALFQDPESAGLLRSDAFEEVAGRFGRTSAGARARNPVELAAVLEELGDLSLEEAQARCEGNAQGWLVALEREGRAQRVRVPARPRAQIRWIAASDAETYQGIADGHPTQAQIRKALTTYLTSREPATAADVANRYGLPVSDVQCQLASIAEAAGLMQGYFTAHTDAPQWASEGVIGAVQARTLSILRAEIEPVGALRFAAATARLNGMTSSPDMPPKVPNLDDVRRALEGLRGVAAHPRDWMDALLASRAPGFSLAVLERLFQDGEFAWVGAPDGAGSFRIRLVPRSSGCLYMTDQEVEIAQAGPDSASPEVERIWGFLREEGAVTSEDLRKAMSGVPVMDLRRALRELILGGLVTANSWRALTAILHESSEIDSGTPRAGERARGRRGSSRREAARRIREATQALPAGVSWMPAARFAILGPAVSEAERRAARAQAILDRHGVASRRAVELEGDDWAWGPLASQLGLMEMRGRVRRGYFVTGLPGLQFASPTFVETLRTEPDVREVAIVPARDVTSTLDRSLADDLPAKEGRLLRFQRVRSTRLALGGDIPLALLEEEGTRVTVNRDEALRPVVRRALLLFTDRQRRRGRTISVRYWNDEAVLESEGAALLSELGFRRDYPRMTFDALQARVLARA